ncbi:hypothetical protein [Streptomyces sp. NRRL S-455]|uniref:hypothetical protein n=1 Tax=Streptomyces sp. NRRL S-455 TaxID=1463908 RepID=UPI0004C0C506|nr:hypothetical protein [Streptomyces sp. NRRL S-455]
MTATCTPFALLVEVPTPPVDRTPEFTFDRLRQLNVTSDGDAVVDVADVQATTMTHNHKGFKKDDDFAHVPHALFGPTMTHNSKEHKKDDD